MRKSSYAKMFTHRADGYYQKKVKGKVLYDKDPEKLYQKWQAALAAENAPPPKRTFREVAEEWQSKHREEIQIRTWNNYRLYYDDLVACYGDRFIEDITVTDVSDELMKLKSKGYYAGPVKTCKTIFSQILDYAISLEEITYNPAHLAKLPKGLKKGKRTAPTEEEMAIITENINQPFGFFPFFLLFTGLRKSEALALTRSDVDLVHRCVNVTKSLVYNDGCNPTVKAPKTECGVRVVPIVDALYVPLVKYLATVSGDILFPAPINRRGKGGGYMTHNAYKVLWRNYCEASGLSLTAHQLRHGAATVMYEAGVDPYTSQRILGHANIMTTMGIYTELRNGQMQKSIDKFNVETRKYIKNPPEADESGSKLKSTSGDK